MLGTGHVFRYVECAACGCLQLLEPPPDMARYYPVDYCGFQMGKASGRFLKGARRFFRRLRNRGFFEGSGWAGRVLARRYRYPQLSAFARMRVGRGSRILDVGCGSGKLLLDLKELGYTNLLGVDLYVPQSMDFGDGVRVIKGGMGCLAGTAWDVVMFHHSFEHMLDPAGVLRLAANLLAPRGKCMIGIPIVGWAWDHYGVQWVQLDAPRHLFLHTEKSFRILADSAGLQVYEVHYDSSEFQFWGSELYARGVAQVSVDMAKPRSIFSWRELRRFRRWAEGLNSERRGDQAIFCLVKR